MDKTDSALSKILIIDFGSQVTKLIARRVRDLGVYAEIIQQADLAIGRKEVVSLLQKAAKIKARLEENMAA